MGHTRVTLPHERQSAQVSDRAGHQASVTSPENHQVRVGRVSKSHSHLHNRGDGASIPAPQRAGTDNCRPTPHPVAACPAPLIRSTGGGGNPSPPQKPRASTHMSHLLGSAPPPTTGRRGSPAQQAS